MDGEYMHAHGQELRIQTVGQMLPQVHMAAGSSIALKVCIGT